MKIYPLRLGITLGIIWGASVISLALVSSKNYGSFAFKLIKNLYTGCSKNNILLCGFLGFIDAFIGGVLIGFIYNNINITK